MMTLRVNPMLMSMLVMYPLSLRFQILLQKTILIVQAVMASLK